MCEKQESLIDLKYFYLNGVRAESRLLLDSGYLAKGETDGSSFPSGGLRYTHRARAYMVRDPLSEIFIRKKNKIMYIPSLLVTHHGLALDDKTIFRKSEAVMKSSALSLLRALGKNPKDIFLALGLEQ
jgi:glutamine synthetase